MVNTLVSPSILSANPLSLLKDLLRIEKAGAEIVPLLDLSKDKPNGKNIRIIG